MCFLLFKILFNKDISLHSKFLLLHFFYKQKLDLNIVIMRKIIVTPEQVVVVEVKMKEVVVLGQRLVVEVQEVEVQPCPPGFELGNWQIVERPKISMTNSM